MAKIKSRSPRPFRLSGVDWQTYSRMLHVFGARPGVRLTYDRGELEIMSPLLEHDNPARFLGWLVLFLTEELGLPIFPGGSVTMRRRRHMRGLEADDCFWIANAHRMAGKKRLDLRIDPPPDVALEVDATRSSLNRMGIYAALRVPEVWRLDGDTLTFHVLGPDGKYTVAAMSRAFPMVTPADLMSFLEDARQAADFHVVIRKFREWIRQRLASGAEPPRIP
jgi:Uma2 family endonuclease